MVRVKLEIGTPVDHVLKTVGWEPGKAAKPPKLVGMDAEGWVVEWYYPSRVVELRHRDGQYRVHEVRNDDD
jgi:hypothetical protein